MKDSRKFSCVDSSWEISFSRTQSSRKEGGCSISCDCSRFHRFWANDHSLMIIVIIFVIDDSVMTCQFLYHLSHRFLTDLVSVKILARSCVSLMMDASRASLFNLVQFTDGIHYLLFDKQATLSERRWCVMSLWQKSHFISLGSWLISVEKWVQEPISSIIFSVSVRFSMAFSTNLHQESRKACLKWHWLSWKRLLFDCKCRARDDSHQNESEKQTWGKSLDSCGCFNFEVRMSFHLSLYLSLCYSSCLSFCHVGSYLNRERAFLSRSQTWKRLWYALRRRSHLFLIFKWESERLWRWQKRICVFLLQFVSPRLEITILNGRFKIKRSKKRRSSSSVSSSIHVCVFMLESAFHETNMFANAFMMRRRET